MNETASFNCQSAWAVPRAEAKLQGMGMPTSAHFVESLFFHMQY